MPLTLGVHRLSAHTAIGEGIMAAVFLQDDLEANGALRLRIQGLLRSSGTLESRSGMRGSGSGGGGEGLQTEVGQAICVTREGVRVPEVRLLEPL